LGRFFGRCGAESQAQKSNKDARGQVFHKCSSHYYQNQDAHGNAIPAKNDKRM
jgi:hypothetical protein